MDLSRAKHTILRDELRSASVEAKSLFPRPAGADGPGKHGWGGVTAPGKHGWGGVTAPHFNYDREMSSSGDRQLGACRKTEQ